MGLLDSLMGGGAQPQQFKDFVQRYDRGAPWDGISDQESLQHYSSVAGELPPDQYRTAAEESLSKLTPHQRQQLLEHLRQQSRRRGVSFAGLQEGEGLHEPGALAGLMSGMRQQQPGILRQLLGGETSGPGALQSPIMKAALGGIAAFGLKKVLGGRGLA